jgi:hypothetical protein
VNGESMIVAIDTVIPRAAGGELCEQRLVS